MRRKRNRIRYSEIMGYIIEILRNGATPSEVRRELEKIGFRIKYNTLFANIIHPAEKLGLIVKKEDSRYYVVPGLEDNIAWKNPKFFSNPAGYLPSVRKRAIKQGRMREKILIEMYPERALEVVKALVDIIKKGGKPNPNLPALRLLLLVKKHGIPSFEYGKKK